MVTGTDERTHKLRGMPQRVHGTDGHHHHLVGPIVFGKRGATNHAHAEPPDRVTVAHRVGAGLDGLGPPCHLPCR